MSAQTLDFGERYCVLQPSIESATLRTASLSLAQICAKSPWKPLFVALRENIFSRIRSATLLRLDYGVTSAATARQAFSFRDRLGEFIVPRALKSLHQSNHYPPSPHTARGATSTVFGV
jgi:hypothetical protein